MAALPTLHLVTVDDYLETGPDEQYEYVDGVLVPRGIGNPLHARCIAPMCIALQENAPDVFVYAGLT